MSLQLGETAPDFVADVTISPGGCLVQTPSAAVDATIEKRWARALGDAVLSWGPDQLWPRITAVTDR